MLDVYAGGRWILVDVTGGNLPLVLIAGEDRERAFRCGMRGRMVYRQEHLRLRRAEVRLGDLLLTMSEFHVSDLHFQYVFDQGLGLHISPHAFVGVYFDWGRERSAQWQQHYTRRAADAGLPRPAFFHEANLAGVPDPASHELLSRTLVSLRAHYPDRHYGGDFTFVWQPLTAAFGRGERIGRDVRALLGEDGS
jgi:hypothetical protein